MMRTVLQIFIALAFCGLTMAQNPQLKNMRPACKSFEDMSRTRAIESAFPAAINQTPVLHPSGTQSLNSTLVASSKNLYSIVYQEQTIITYNPDIDALMFTCRGNQFGSVAVLGTGDDVTNHYSFDRGATWSHKLFPHDGYFHRYPSGVMYNPAGNVDTSALYSVMVGPTTDGTNWTNTYYLSEKIDGTGSSTRLIPTSSYQEAMMQGLTATSDGKFHVSTCEMTISGSSYSAVRMYYANGVWNTGTNVVDWDTAGFVPNVTKSTSGGVYSNGAYSNEAWAHDGSVGYLMTLASDNRPAAKPSFVPILWKSTDAGTTWNIMAYWDWSQDTMLTDHILPTNNGPYRPMFDEADIVVDYQGLPHIFAHVHGAYSTNIDSLNYYWSNVAYGTIPDGNIFELYLSVAVSPLTSSTGNVGWDHRVQGSVSPDGKRVFATWTDSDWQFWGTDPYDLNPDLMGWGRKLDESFAWPVNNFTKNTPMWGIAYFHLQSAAGIFKSSSPLVYEIPITDVDLATGGMNADNPVYHYYLQGVDFIEPTGIQVNKTGAISVSAPYPDPVNGKTHIDINLPVPGNISLITTNVTGQVVLSKDYGTLTAGTHTLTIDATGLNSGIYFNTLTAGNEKVTKKMIVR
jgi:hypothetical protein